MKQTLKVLRTAVRRRVLLRQGGTPARPAFEVVVDGALVLRTGARCCADERFFAEMHKLDPVRRFGESETEWQAKAPTGMADKYVPGWVKPHMSF